MLERRRVRTRDDAEVAISTLRRRGLKLIAVDERERVEFERAAAVARQTMSAELYPAALLEAVERAAFATP